MMTGIRGSIYGVKNKRNTTIYPRTVYSAYISTCILTLSELFSNDTEYMYLSENERKTFEYIRIKSGTG